MWGTRSAWLRICINTQVNRSSIPWSWWLPSIESATGGSHGRLSWRERAMQTESNQVKTASMRRPPAGKMQRLRTYTHAKHVFWFLYLNPSLISHSQDAEVVYISFPLHNNSSYPIRLQWDVRQTCPCWKQKCHHTDVRMELGFYSCWMPEFHWISWVWFRSRLVSTFLRSSINPLTMWIISESTAGAYNWRSVVDGLSTRFVYPHIKTRRPLSVPEVSHVPLQYHCVRVRTYFFSMINACHSAGVSVIAGVLRYLLFSYHWWLGLIISFIRHSL